ncbi:MAG: hypothetical protein U0165_12005 [Polyangiaceae bacterium]
MGKPVPPILGEGLVTRRIEVPAKDTVYVRAHLEASEGLGILFAERGGSLTLATTLSQEAALDGFIDDLATELDVIRVPTE